MVRLFLKNSAAVSAGMLASLVLAGHAWAGYLNNDPNDALDPPFNPANYATQLISASGSMGQTSYDVVYNNPSAVLGAPNLWFANSGGGDLSPHAVKIVEAPVSLSPSGKSLNTQLNNSTLTRPFKASPGTMVVKMGSPVYADPTHPYGIDFVVYGNTYFSGTGGNADDSTDLNNYGIGGLYGHSTSISVSQDGANWYTYPDVPALLPYSAYQWNRASASWSSHAMDQLKPVNPGVYALLPMNLSSGPGGASMSAADAMEVYGGAAGGTGYSLQGTGLSSIQYIKVTAGDQATQPNHTYTVIDAFAKTRSMVVGDNLTVTSANITGGTGALYFQNPRNVSQTMVRADFRTVSDPATFSTGFINDPALLAAAAGPVLGAYQLNVAKCLQTGGSPAYTADLQLLASGYLGNAYHGDGSDLLVKSWNGSVWQSVAFRYDSATGTVDIDGWSQPSSSLVISQNALPGDANLDGRISVDDYLALDLGYLFGLSGWSHGDFSNSGTVQAADFAIIDHQYATQNASAGQSEIALHEQWFGAAYSDALAALDGTSPVPEPASLGVAALGGLLLWCRRGSRQRRP